MYIILRISINLKNYLKVTNDVIRDSPFANHRDSACVFTYYIYIYIHTTYTLRYYKCK